MARKKKDSMDQPSLLEARVSTAPCVPGIRVSDQWRIRLDWRDGNAEQVEIVDYH